MKAIQRKLKDANKILVIKSEGKAPLGEGGGGGELQETVCDVDSFGCGWPLSTRQ